MSWGWPDCDCQQYVTVLEKEIDAEKQYTIVNVYNNRDTFQWGNNIIINSFKSITVLIISYSAYAFIFVRFNIMKLDKLWGRNLKIQIGSLKFKNA